MEITIPAVGEELKVVNYGKTFFEIPAGTIIKVTTIRELTIDDEELIHNYVRLLEPVAVYGSVVGTLERQETSLAHTDNQ